MNALGNCARCGEMRPCPCDEPAPGYVSPFGKPVGLAARLDRWRARLGTDHTLPWVGLGLIADLECAVMAFQQLREFAEHLQTNGTSEQRALADEILRNEETLQAVTQALADGGLRNFDQVAGVETLNRERDAAIGELEQVRSLLVETGALAADDYGTPVVVLLRVLLG